MATRGRKKIEVTDTIIKRVESLASRGLMDKEIISMLGWSHDSFYKKKRAVKEFSEAIERGRATGHAAVANKLFDACMAGSVSAMQYYLARRAGWTEKDSGKRSEDEVPPPLNINFQVNEAQAPITVTRGKPKSE